MQQTDDGQKGTWQFHNEDEPGLPAEQPFSPDDELAETTEPVTWTASEFIAHHKDPLWYVTMFGGLLAFCGLIYFFTRDIISVVTIVIVAVLYLIISKAKPRQRAYTVDSNGISIDEKFYSFNDFKSFSVSQEGAIGSVVFMPLKRLMPELSIYFAAADGQKIIDVLGGSLPNEQRPERKTDKLMKRLHF